MAISNNSTGLRPGVCTSSTRPTAPYEGQMIYETDTDRVAIWNGTAWFSFSATVPDLPSGTALLFQQTTAPTGWTKQTTHNNKSLRVVTGTASSGGSNTFTAAFNTSFATSGGAVSDTTLTTAQMPSHNHTTRFDSTAGGGILGHAPGGGTNSGYVLTTSNTGGGTAHGHGFTQPSFNLNVQYVDVIIATKD
jgi:hypothetical protein